MFKKNLFVAASLLIALSMILAACAPQTVEVVKTVTVETEKEVVKTVEVVTEKETIVEVTPTAVPSTRVGGWLDTITVVEEPSTDAAISRMIAGDVDIYAFTVANAQALQKVKEAPELTYQQSYGSYNELTFNPVGPVFETTGALNPFSNPKIREAMNWLIDRDYIANEVTGGMAIPRFFAFSPVFAEAARYADIVAQWETFYSYNKAKATEVIDAEMTAMGATKVDGKWQFNGAPVTIIYLIRVEDERRQIGDYVANELESIGFTSDRQYKTSAEASPIWYSGDPAEGKFHIYTGGWVTTVVPRTEEDNFIDFHAPDGFAGTPLWDAYVNDPAFYEAGIKLYNREYKTLEERRELFAQVIPLQMQDAHRVWTTNRASFTPYRKEVSVTANLAGAVAGSTLWPFTIRRVGEEGGSLKMAMPSILTSVWNPIDGSNWVYDAALYRATQDYGVFTDPWTGLNLPQRIEKAEVTTQEELPIGASPSSASWLTHTKAAEIEVPADAWIDWNAETETFITVGEVYTQGLTALTKSVVYYPAELWNSTWHDGTPVNIADFVIGTILTFDRASELSDVYDPAAATQLRNFKATFRGFRIVSEDPFVVEWYSDNWAGDAENLVASLWPNYARGTASWYSMAVGLRAEAAGETAFTAAKSKTLEKDHMSYISGPTVALLKAQLDAAKEENYIPYAATLGKYVSAETATASWANYAEWYRSRGHFWIGTGPYYLERAFPTEGIVILQHYGNFVDLASKWAGYGLPKVAVVDVTAPAKVEIGKEATFDVDITFEGEAYPASGIDSVSYLLFAADGTVASKGEATFESDGFYTVKLSAEETGKLTAGSSKLMIVVVSNLVSIPGKGVAEFPVAAP